MNILVSQNDIDSNKRLDLYLALKLPEYSRSFIKKTIEENKVLVNGELCYKAGYKVRQLDVIEFPEIEAPHTSVQDLPKSQFDLEVIFEDEDYLFINKPIGLIVHPANSHQNNTLVNKLLSLNHNLPGTNILRPGIVHRLDKDTSGVIAVAKTPKALWWLSQQFADRKVKKQYRSIGVCSYMKFPYKLGQEVMCEGFMRRSNRDRKQYTLEPVTKTNPQGRYSKSVFTILDTFAIDNDHIVVFAGIYPHTGRTHQIRVHQKSLGFTIMNDPIYMSTKEKQWAGEFLEGNGIKNRLYLHAHTLSFENYDGKLYSITAELPEEYTILLDYAQKARTATN